MRSVTHFFARHPKAVGETYFQHMCIAFSFGTKMLLSGLACLAHGVFPFLWEATASNTIRKLHHTMEARQPKRETQEQRLNN